MMIREEKMMKEDFYDRQERHQREVDRFDGWMDRLIMIILILIALMLTLLLIGGVASFIVVLM